MDLYKRKRGEWTAKAKGLDNPASQGDAGERPKSKLDLARARFAANLEQQGASKKRKTTSGANSEPVATSVVRTK